MDKIQSNRKFIAICLVAAMIAFAVVVGCLVFILPDKSPDTKPVVTPDEIATVDEVTQPDVTSVTVTEPTVAVTAVSGPEELTDILSLRGNTYEELSAAGCKQLVTVVAQGNAARIRFFEFADGVWSENESLATDGFVGVEGAIEDMSEQRSGSPVGLYPIGDAFYIGEAPVTSLASFGVTQDTYWVDDPNSAFYNQRVEGTAEQDWVSAEHMIDYGSSYEYGFVINYNMPAVPGAGSAIFFHVGNVPTQGCVATSRDMVLEYLGALDANLNPYILIN